MVGEEPKEEKALKPIEFTHYLNPDKGWDNDIINIIRNKGEVVTYLGNCTEDGDMFMTRDSATGYVRIYKGHLNDGVY